MYEDIPAKDNIIKKLLDFNKHSQFGTMTIDQFGKCYRASKIFEIE